MVTPDQEVGIQITQTMNMGMIVVLLFVLFVINNKVI